MNAPIADAATKGYKWFSTYAQGHYDIFGNFINAYQEGPESLDEVTQTVLKFIDTERALLPEGK